MTALSIITVVKDDPVGLQRTIESVRRQGSIDAEFLIVDGSKAPLVGAIDIPIPARVITEPPTGIYPAMNTGLAQARGQYVYFLNAGDTLAEDRVGSRIITELRDAGFPGWAFGAVRFTDPRGRLLRERHWDYSVERAHHFARGVFPAHQGIVARTETVRALGGFDSTLRIAADYALMLRLSQQSDPLRWDWTIAEFRQGGASSQHWWRAQNEFHEARLAILELRGWPRVAEQGATVRAKTRALVSRVISSMRA